MIGLVFGVRVGIFDILFDIVHPLLEAPDALSDSLHELGDLFTAEKQQDDERDEDDLAGTQVAEK